MKILNAWSSYPFSSAEVTSVSPHWVHADHTAGFMHSKQVLYQVSSSLT